MFRSFSETRGRRHQISFHFLWFRDVQFQVISEPRTSRLTFVRLLPGVPARSAMDRAFRAFVASRSSASLSESQRVDLRKVQVRVINCGGNASLEFVLNPGHVEYGVEKAVHLVHDVLMNFLNDSQYVEYNITHFNLNRELA
jgi:hypothetical protein